MSFTPEKATDALCISIGSSGQEDGRLVAGLTERFSRVLRLSFDDIGTNIETMRAFNQELALEVVGAVKNISKDAEILIHCEGGVSRSVAVGVFLSKMLNRRLILHSASDYSMVNHFVLQQLKKAYLRDRIRRLKLPRYALLTLQPQNVHFTIAPKAHQLSV